MNIKNKDKFNPPGLVTRSMNPEVLMMICTAGHVDHGKTALVKLLTGCNTDRLKEEQERGMTIELGFAPCFLGGNLSVGIVDVPGHEKFIRNMVSGVSGIEMTVLVIAADDGVMPQTIEHLQIMQLLGVRRGMIALTKIDLVAQTRIAELTDQIRGFLKGTFLCDAPICPVSSVTYEGYDLFYNTLVQTIKGIMVRRRSGIFRMPVERAFSRAGFGVVVTGIPVDGIIHTGDEVEIVPGNMKGKVRGIQRFLRDASEGGYGQCLALNIPDFNRKPPVRGEVLSLPGYLHSSRIFHISLKTVPNLARPLRNAEEVKFHTGTVEASGKIYLLENREIGANETAPATIVLDAEIAAAAGDNFILRRPSPAETMAGGGIVEIIHSEHRPSRQASLEKINTHLSFFLDVDPLSEEAWEKKVEYHLAQENPKGSGLREISFATLLPRESVEKALLKLQEAQKILVVSGNHYMDVRRYGALLDSAVNRLDEVFTREKALSLKTEDLKTFLDCPDPVWNRLELDLEERGLVKRSENRFILKASSERMEKTENIDINRICGIYEKSGFESPRPDELPGLLKLPQEKIDQLLEHLCNEGKLIQLDKKVVLSRNHFIKAQDIAVKAISEKGVLDSADFKNLIQSTRKYALAVLDHLDKIGVTIRIENNRKLSPDYKKYLICKL
jgi:selenocysteine-specific elongation factor